MRTMRINRETSIIQEKQYKRINHAVSRENSIEEKFMRFSGENSIEEKFMRFSGENSIEGKFMQLSGENSIEE